MGRFHSCRNCPRRKTCRKPCHDVADMLRHTADTQSVHATDVGNIGALVEHELRCGRKVVVWK